MKQTAFICSLIAMNLLSACGGELEADYPKIIELERVQERGRMTGDGMMLMGRDEPAYGGGGASPIGVNSFLWRASLETISFLPLRSADPFGGVIITDWYEAPKTPGERYKLNILINDKALRADALKVSVFRQSRDPQTGEWVDAEINSDIARTIEDAILTSARELRIKQTAPAG